MTSYKSTHFRRANAPKDSPAPDPLRPKIAQLQELFPHWSDEGPSLSSFSLVSPLTLTLTLHPPPDLRSLLTELNGDLELAATRITDGPP